MVFYFIFFCVWLWLFRAHSPSNGCSEDGQRLGWGKNQKTAFQKARPGALVFAVRTRSRRFLGREEQAKDGEQRDVRPVTPF